MTDFTWYGSVTYTPPNYNAVDFSFVANNEGSISVSGSSATAFAPIVTTDITGQGATSFGGYVYGTAECSAAITGSGSIGIHIYANLDTEASVAGSVSSQSFPTQSFGAGTFSEYQHNGVLTAVAQAFGTAGLAVQGNAATLFEPYYAFTIPGISSVAIGFGGVADGSTALLGEASEANNVQTVMATAAWSVGRTVQDMLATRLKPTQATCNGAALTTVYLTGVQPTTATIFCGVTSALTLSGVWGAATSVLGTGAFDPLPTAYATASISISAAGELIYYQGAITNHTATLTSLAAFLSDSGKLLAGVLGVADGVAYPAFSAEQRVQGLRYKTTYVQPAVERVFFAELPEQVSFVDNKQEEVYAVSKQVAVYCKPLDNVIWVLPRDVAVAAPL